ncbi:MAG: toxin-antitoxin system HicB family antitoxin [Xenococcaceae cyanobacterium]
MAAINIRLSDEKHERLKKLAKSKNISVNKLMEELATIALTEFDTETRFKLLASRGSVERGLELIRKAQQHFED